MGKRVVQGDGVLERVLKEVAISNLQMYRCLDEKASWLS